METQASKMIERNKSEKRLNKQSHGKNQKIQNKKIENTKVN